MIEQSWRIGPFEVIDVLGRGGMGVVYRARDPALNNRVAIKTVSLANEQFLASIRREIHALRRLDHPGVVRILSSGVDAGQPWYAMELLQGNTLATLRDSVSPQAISPPIRSLGSLAHRHTDTMDTLPFQGPPSSVVPSVSSEIPRDQLLRIFTVVQRLLSTLAYIHGEGIVHRDIKPQNVFLRDDDQPVLVDFGIASRSAGMTGREVLDVPLYMAGSPAYIAPEQIRGDSVDSRSDLYAVGCVFYELLTGQPPFLGDVALVMHLHLEVTPRPPSELVAGLRPELDRLVLAMLEKRPRDRLGHAEDVMYALEELGAPRERPIRRPRAYLYRPELTGRTSAMSALESAALAASRGEGGCLLIAGESGVGKTYLALEAARASRGFQVVTGTCTPIAAFDRGPAGQLLHPFARLFQLITDRCVAGGRTATDHLLGQRGKILSEHEPSLAGMPGQDAYPAPPVLHGTARRDRLLAALGDTIAALSEHEPILVVLDDLQWADDVSMRLLTTLGDDWFHGKRVLVIGAYRIEETTQGIGELLSRPYVHRLELGKLDEVSVGSLVSDMLAIERPPDTLIHFLARHSAGNPFFIAEYLRAAIAEGLLRRGGRGRLQVGRLAADDDGPFDDVPGLPLPITMPELVSRRLVGLPPVSRRLAAYASVIGHEFDPELLREAARASEAEVLDGLAELVARQILDHTDTGGLQFVHDKLCEIVYEQQDPASRRAMHRDIAEAIERRAAAADAVPRFYAPLAHHYLSSGVEDKAIRYLEKAGEHALVGGAYVQASDLHTKLLALTEGRAATDASVAYRRVPWMHSLARAQMGLGRLVPAETHARAALAVLGLAVPDSTAGWVRLIAIETLRRIWLMYGPSTASQHTPDVRQKTLIEAAQLASLLTNRYYYVGDVLSLVGCSLLSVNWAERGTAGSLVPRAYAWLGYVLGVLRQHELSMRHFHQAYDAASHRADVLAQANVLNVQAVYHIGAAAFDAATTVALKALKLGETDAQQRELSLNILGHIAYYTGRFEESLQRYVHLFASAKNRANHQHVTWCIFTQARAMTAQGRAADGLSLLYEARARLAEHPELDSEIITLGLLAAAEAATGNAGAARDAVRATLERIRRARPGGFSVIDGYDGAATALLVLARRGDVNAGIEDEARELLAAMTRLARLFPMVRPYALLHRGELERLRGRDWRAVKLFTQARDLADDLGMYGLRARAAITVEQRPA